MTFLRAAACLAIAVLAAACSGGQSGYIPGAVRGDAGRAASARYVYVANLNGNTIAVYKPGGSAVARTISEGLSGPRALALDAKGYVYAVNYNDYRVTVYAPGGTKLVRTLIAGSGPRALAFDSHGDLYVANYLDSSVMAFAPGKTKPFRTLTPSKGIDHPFSIAFDRLDNLYVSNASAIEVYAQGSKRTLSIPGSFGAIAASPDDRLYAATSTSVAVYTLRGALVRTLVAGIDAPSAFAFTHFGTAYVANAGQNFDQVTIYPRSGTKPGGEITIGIDMPSAMAFDRNGDLFVANAREGTPGSVTIYAPGEDAPKRTLTKGINDPQALAFGTR